MLADYTVHITDTFMQNLTWFLVGIIYGLVGMIGIHEWARRKGK